MFSQAEVKNRKYGTLICGQQVSVVALGVLGVAKCENHEGRRKKKKIILDCRTLTPPSQGEERDTPQ
jgi:hypothetical protein